MEIPVTAGPWLVLGLVLGLLLAVLGALGVAWARHRPGRGTGPDSTSAAPVPVVDDLPGFLDSPPGSTPAPPVPEGGWAALSAPTAPAAAEPVRRDATGGTGVLAAMAVAALLLIGAAAAVATARAPEPATGDPGARGEPARTSAEPLPGAVSAELDFESVVLERHAVGVTVASPRVRVTVADGRATAEVELATFNCLRDEAPQDPAAAGCTRSVTEYAELSEPELRVRVGDALHAAGAFATWRRPNGAPPVATGRVYELTVTAAPRDGDAGDGREPATGLLELGGEQAPTRDDGTNAITYGG